MVPLQTAASTILSIVTIITLGSPCLNLFTKLVDELSGAISMVHYPPDRRSEIARSCNISFDFVIVGGGSAGSVLASRLSENQNWSVLVIEAGHDPYFFTEIPAMAFALQYTDQNYLYMPEFQSGACLGMLNQVCRVDKGKVLGGSSVINGMLYSTGNRRDYDLWAAAGNEGWSYDEVLPYFKKSQQMQPDYIEKYGTADFGAHGPLPLRKANSTFNAIEDIVLEAAAFLGYPILDGFPATNQIGFGKTHQTMEYGRRVSTAKAFLAPVRHRKNLYVMKNTRADRIVIEKKVTSGVTVTLADGSTRQIKANKEVILSAGSIATPQLLMLSGIGPSDHLREMGINVVADLPVGKNLQDHIMWLAPMFTYRNNSRPCEFELIMTGLTEYVANHTGYLATATAIDLTGFINTKNRSDDYPNIQFMGAAMPKNAKLSASDWGFSWSFRPEMHKQLYNQVVENDTIFIIPILLHPNSIGHLELRSADPSDTPRIFLNYFNDTRDIETLMTGMDFVKSLAATDTFKKYGLTFTHLAPAACEVYDADSRDYWECNMRHVTSTVWHHVGTAKMGPANDKSTVVDPQLRVHGIHRLRVIDASIMPSITSGNTNAPTIMIAEKGSDMIKAAWH